MPYTFDDRYDRQYECTIECVGRVLMPYTFDDRYDRQYECTIECVGRVLMPYTVPVEVTVLMTIMTVMTVMAVMAVIMNVRAYQECMTVIMNRLK